MERETPRINLADELNATVADLQKRAEVVLYVGDPQHLVNLHKAVATSVRGINELSGPADGRVKTLVDMLVSRCLLLRKEIEAREKIRGQPERDSHHE